MKVTDEMVLRAHAAYWCSTVPANEPKMRAALEAALAAVPVPTITARTATAIRWKRAYDHAEAKLAKVRELALNIPGTNANLLAVLDILEK